VMYTEWITSKRQKVSSTGIEPVTDGFQYLLQSTALPTELRREFLLLLLTFRPILKSK
jgi:hypothetical protein